MLAICLDIHTLMSMAVLSSMVQDIGIDHGIATIIIRALSRGDLVYIIIPGPVGDFPLDSGTVGLVGDFIRTDMVGGGLDDIEPATGMGIAMAIDVDIMRDTKPGNEMQRETYIGIALKVCRLPAL